MSVAIHLAVRFYQVGGEELPSAERRSSSPVPASWSNLQVSLQGLAPRSPLLQVAQWASLLLPGGHLFGFYVCIISDLVRAAAWPSRSSTSMLGARIRGCKWVSHDPDEPKIISALGRADRICIRRLRLVSSHCKTQWISCIFKKCIWNKGLKSSYSSSWGHTFFFFFRHFWIYKKTSMDGIHLASTFHLSYNTLRYHHQMHCLGPALCSSWTKKSVSSQSSTDILPAPVMAWGCWGHSLGYPLWQGLTSQACPTASVGSGADPEAVPAPWPPWGQMAPLWGRQGQASPAAGTHGRAWQGAVPASWIAATYTRNGLSQRHLLYACLNKQLHRILETASARTQLGV